MTDRAALAALTDEIVVCRRCPRLVAWRELVAREKVARFRDETYWGRPLPGFGDPDARILLVGLAPAAHGGNRTGRVFTGDASGDFLWAALHAQGLADRPVSRRADDGPDPDRYVHRRGGPLRAAAQQADHRGARRLRAVPGSGARAADARSGSSSPSAQFGWDAALRAMAALRAVPRGRSRGSGTAPRRRSGRTSCLARITRASRTRSPAGSRRRCSTPCSTGEGGRGRLTASASVASAAAAALPRGRVPTAASGHHSALRPAADDLVEPLEHDARQRPRLVDERRQHRHPMPATDALRMHRDGQRRRRRLARMRSAARPTRSRAPRMAAGGHRARRSARRAASHRAPSRPAPRRDRRGSPQTVPSATEWRSPWRIGTGGSRRP